MLEDHASPSAADAVDSALAEPQVSGIADLETGGAAADEPSTEEMVESTLNRVDEDLAKLNAALEPETAATTETSIAPDPAVNPVTPGGELDPDCPQPEPLNLSEAAEDLLNEQRADANQGLICRMLRPFVGMLTLMDVPFAGMNQGSKSIIGHIAIATILVAIMTWVLGGLGYLEGY